MKRVPWFLCQYIVLIRVWLPKKDIVMLYGFWIKAVLVSLNFDSILLLLFTCLWIEHFDWHIMLAFHLLDKFHHSCLCEFNSITAQYMSMQLGVSDFEGWMKATLSSTSVEMLCLGSIHVRESLDWFLGKRRQWLLLPWSMDSMESQCLLSECFSSVAGFHMDLLYQLIASVSYCSGIVWWGRIKQLTSEDWIKQLRSEDSSYV